MHRLDQRLRRLAASVNRLRRKWLSLALLCTICMLSCLSGRIYAAEDAVFSHKNDAMKIALTFDDGPHAEYTRQILDILEEYHVHATFFMIGINAQRHPELVSAVADAGHEIGNHTYSHDKPYQMSIEALLGELQTTEEIIESSSDCAPVLFRPPEGVNTPVISEAASEMGYRIILWSVDTRDWDSRTTLQSAVDNVLTNTSSGSIILFHDAVSRKVSITPDAIRAVIPALLDRGYQFVTVSELLGTS